MKLPLPSAPVLRALAFVFALASVARAQDVAPPAKANQGTRGIEVQAPRPAGTNGVKTINTNIVTDAKAAEDKLRPLLTYSGVGPEVARSTNRWRIFSLRRPVDRKEDGANLIRDIRTEASPAIKIFSIDF